VHTTLKKKALGKRLRIILGQLNAIEGALAADRDSRAILQLVSIVRGAMDSLMAEMVDEHLRFHVLVPAERPRDERPELEEVIETVRRYLK
jgi:DNA-binding FrmR family transcriptional regulator